MATLDRTVTDIFDDAKLVHSQALERLAADDPRDAAEKAWCATRRATDALILARTGELPDGTHLTRRRLDELARQDDRVSILVGRFYTRLSDLHGECFYLGVPLSSESLRRIRETDQYIADAERLAGV